MPQDREFVDGIVLRISGDKPLTANSSDEVVARIGRLLTEAGLHESTIEIFLPLDLLALQTERIMIRTLRGQEWPVESRFCVTIRSTERHCRTDFVDDLNFQTFWRQAWQEVERGRPPQSFFRSDLTQLCDSKRADVLRSGCAVPLLPFPPTQNVLQDLIDAGIAVAVWSNDTESIAQHLGSADVFEWKRLVLDFKRKNTTAVSTSLFLDSPSIPPGLGSRSHMLSDWSDFT